MAGFFGAVLVLALALVFLWLLCRFGTINAAMKGQVKLGFAGIAFAGDGGFAAFVVLVCLIALLVRVLG